MNLLLSAIAQLARLIAEWAERRRDLYIEPRWFPSVIQEAWAPKSPKIRR
jgi:hypothetical protein